MKSRGGIWVGMPVSLKREGFYRILKDKIQTDLFAHFMGEGIGEKQKEISLSNEELESYLNHK